MDKPVKINLLSKLSVYIDILSCGNAKISSATGFLYKSDEQIFLITNKHVVIGRSIETNELLGNTGGLPNKLDLFVCSKAKNQSTTPGQSVIHLPKGYLDLYEDKKGVWLEHKNSKVDLVAIPMGYFDDNEFKNSLHMLSDIKFRDFSSQIGNEVFIIGYPAGLTGGAKTQKLPLWKRGTIASEPDIDHGTLPRVIIDSATYKGMSGSLVIARKQCFSVEQGERDSAISISYHDMFLGVYSGRLNSRIKEDDKHTQLGIVWKKHLIDDIIKNGKKTNTLKPDC